MTVQRRRFQFSLSFLFAMIAVVALGCLLWRLHPALTLFYFWPFAPAYVSWRYASKNPLAGFVIGCAVGGALNIFLSLGMIGVHFLLQRSVPEIAFAAGWGLCIAGCCLGAVVGLVAATAASERRNSRCRQLRAKRRQIAPRDDAKL